MAKILTNMFKDPYNSIKIKINEEWKKRMIFLFLLCSCIVFIVLANSTNVTKIIFLLSLPPTVNLSLFFYVLGTVLFLLSFYFLSKMFKIKPSNEESVFFYSYQAIKQLEDFLDNPKLIFLKNNASRNVKKANLMLQYWNIGNLEFISNKIKKPFNDYTNNFKIKLNSIIKYGSPKDIANLIPFFHQLLNFLLMKEPKIEDFLIVTDSFEKLKEIPPTKKQLEQIIPYYEKVTGYINRNNIVKHIIHFGIIGGMSYIFYYVGSSIEGVGIGNSYMAGVTVFVGFTALKLTIMYKKREFKQ